MHYLLYLCRNSCCRKPVLCRSTTEGRHFEISLKLCALFALQVCAKGAQHHNKQKTTLHACKHLAKFAANLCRKVELCRSTYEGRHFEISLKYLTYVHYWLYKFVQRVHNITTSKKQLYMLVNTLLNLPQTCAEKLSCAVVQMRVDTLKFH